jgi:hypothetical protein
MKYHPVDRIVTVEFDKEAHGSGYEVRVTPKHFVMRYGDTITWVVQGLPRGLAKEVRFCNIHATEPCARVLRVKKGARKGLVQHAVRRFETPDVKVGNGFRATARSGQAELGRYKYDIYFGDELLLDPDGEVKGPRH